ncbi:MAG: hypothetical protein E5W28_00325 [Mesorhizobium sp.]|nr:MAG: hypothetical protein E5W28_00325 [Mesorhizobium sp.]
MLVKTESGQPKSKRFGIGVEAWPPLWRIPLPKRVSAVTSGPTFVFIWNVNLCEINGRAVGRNFDSQPNSLELLAVHP